METGKSEKRETQRDKREGDREVEKKRVRDNKVRGDMDLPVPEWTLSTRRVCIAATFTQHKPKLCAGILSLQHTTQVDGGKNCCSLDFEEQGEKGEVFLL